MRNINCFDTLDVSCNYKKWQLLLRLKSLEREVRIITWKVVSSTQPAHTK